MSILNSQFGFKGFTFIELIIVIIVLGILAASITYKIGSTKSYSVAAEIDILKANLRYAQFRALSYADTTYGVNNATWGISLSGNSYTLQKNRVNATMYFPGEISSTHDLPSGISITTGAGTTITYDVWGRPVDTSTPGIPITNNVTIIISETNGASPKTITVTQNTGFIP